MLARRLNLARLNSLVTQGEQGKLHHYLTDLPLSLPSGMGGFITST